MRGKTGWFWWLLSIAVVIVIALAAVFAYGLYYSNRALPGTSVAGTDVSGQTRAQITALVAQKEAETTVEVDIDGNKQELTLAQLGMSVDPEGTADDVLAPNRSWWNRLTKAFSHNDVAAKINGDSAQLNAAISDAASQYVKVAKNAEVTADDASGTFVVTPSEAGTEFDRSALQDTVEAAAASLQSQTLALNLEPVEPRVNTEEAQKVADKANALLATNVELTDGIDKFTPEVAEKMQWIAIPSSPDQLGDPTVDSTKVAAWVDKTAQATNADPKPGVRNLNSRGEVVSVVEEATPGWKVNNSADLAKQVSESLSQGKAFAGEFNYDRPASDKWEERTIADGAENLAYKAAPGEKWIDIDLTNYTVSAYEGATIVRGPVAMVPGKPSTPTVTGTFKTYLQYTSQTMRGEDYVTPDVPWVTYFTGSYALHGAPWRSSFGYGGDAGSHGCINMPVDEAQWFFQWAGIGTTTVSHY